MNDDQLRDIVILGGGTAGWMAAALFAGKLGSSGARIRLVESEDIGIIGVGEATTPALTRYHILSGIDEADFVRKTQGTFKLGIEFWDWGTVGNRHFHAFGDYGHVVEGVSAHHYWLRLRQAGEKYPIDDYSFPYWIAKSGRFAPTDPASPKYLHAYHFDAGLYARYLREIAEARGVERIEGKVTSVSRNADSGNIETLHLANDVAVSGDFFIDCTGFASELLGKALQTPFIDWSHWLLCNRAIAMPSTVDSQPHPFTRSTAHEGGWRWTIPLQHRTGNGMVYSSDHWSDDAALDALKSSVGGEPLAEPRLFNFTSGRRQVFWSHNCVALGFAGGFLEPLESTGIQFIVTGLARLLQYFPGKSCDFSLRDEYNRDAILEMERARDFIIAHYCLSQRPESLWQTCREMALPDFLRHKLEVWRACGQVVLGELESYSEPSWVAILLGNGAVPSRYNVLANLYPLEDIRKGMIGRREEMMRAAYTVPPHSAYIDRYCKAEPMTLRPVVQLA